MDRCVGNGPARAHQRHRRAHQAIDHRRGVDDRALSADASLGGTRPGKCAPLGRTVVGRRPRWGREIGVAAIASHGRSSYPYIPALAWPILAYTQALRLDRDGAQQSLANWAAANVRGAARSGLLIDALTLPAERFEAAVDLTRDLPSSRAPMHVFSAGGLAVDVEIGARLGDGALLELALERLNTLHSQAVVLLLPVGASVDRLRGMALFGLARSTSRWLSSMMSPTTFGTVAPLSKRCVATSSDASCRPRSM